MVDRQAEEHKKNEFGLKTSLVNNNSYNVTRTGRVAIFQLHNIRAQLGE